MVCDYFVINAFLVLVRPKICAQNDSVVLIHFQDVFLGAPKMVTLKRGVIETNYWVS